MMIEKTCPMVETALKHIIIEDIITDWLIGYKDIS